MGRFEGVAAPDDQAGILAEVQSITQEQLNIYGAGVTINQVTFDNAQPPKEGVLQLDASGEEPEAAMPLARSVPLTLGADGTATTNVTVDQPIIEPTQMAVARVE